MKNKKIYFLVEAAVLAALYVVLTVLVAPIAFGPVQFRISEALMLLPALMPASVLGLPLGVFLANLLFGGLGWIDITFGTLATILVVIVTRWLAVRFQLTPETSKLSSSSALWKKPGLYTLPIPAILFNALIVGSYLPILLPELRTESSSFVMVLLVSILQLAVSEAVVVYVLGLAFFVGLFHYFSKRRT